MNNKAKYVRASDIGACSYCAYQHYLRQTEGDSPEVKKRLAAGHSAHDKFNRKHRTSSLLGIVVALIALAIVFLLLRNLP